MLDQGAEKKAMKTNTPNQTHKSYLCVVEYHIGVTSSVSVTSPKTGMTLTLKSPAWHYALNVTAKIKAAAPSGGKGQCFLTVKDLREFLEATEVARDDYKDGLSRGEPICTRNSEATDGECAHCDELLASRSPLLSPRYRLGNYQGGL